MNLGATSKLQKWEVNLPRNFVLMEQGTDPQAMYILLDGKIQVFVNDKLVGELSKPGTYLGEVSFLLSNKVTATCKAKTNVKCLEIKTEYIDDFLEATSPGIIYRLGVNMAERIAEIDKSLTLIERDIISADDPNPIYRISHYKGKEWNNTAEELSKSELTLKQGEILMTEDSSPKYLFILKSGSLLISKEGKQINHVSEPGDCIGEVGFLLNKDRTATVTAATQSVVIRLDRKTFERRIQLSAPFARLILSNIARRLVNLSDRLAQKS
jgi:CRP-like cAMP-binding protein